MVLPIFKYLVSHIEMFMQPARTGISEVHIQFLCSLLSVFRCDNDVLMFMEFCYLSLKLQKEELLQQSVDQKVQDICNNMKLQNDIGCIELVYGLPGLFMCITREHNTCLQIISHSCGISFVNHYKVQVLIYAASLLAV